MKKNDEDLVNKCMEIRVEGRRPLGRTWLESVEADMTEQDIDIDVHDRKKWRKNVMKWKSNLSENGL